MQEVKKYPSGTFSWVDLATTDAVAARKFYAEVFGWQSHDVSAGPEGVYTMLTLEGREVAGLYEMNAAQRSQGIPPHWLSYVSVDDIAATAEKVSALGGSVIEQPFDVMGSGHMAVVQDSTGATFALWQPAEHIGAKLVNMPGALSWNELATTDTDKAGAFYRGLFGWEIDVTEMPQANYYSFTNQGRMAGGMLAMDEKWGDMPPTWAVYFAVADCDASAQKVQEVGGTVLMQPTDIPGTGRFAVVQDPQGATFYIIKMDVADPPPGYEA